MIYPLESKEQIAFIERVTWLHPRLLCHVVAVPNGGLRSKFTAARLKKEGVRPGFPDLIVLLPRGGYHGLLIEMKRIHGGIVSDVQSELHALYRSVGYRVEVCCGATAAWIIFEEYVNGSVSRIAR